MKDLPVSAFTFSQISLQSLKWNNFSLKALIIVIFYLNKRLLIAKNNYNKQKNDILAGAWA